ncbi:MAG: helix-turn-helix transcriptional regulator [Chloroflexi bacterium]|jgi:transcriptional regulator with XRE-family HTH domain|nr:helix-turn-helix transcriptional regulator [Chloroflexota bacterium]
MKNISTITTKYREEQELTQEQFGEVLFEHVPGMSAKSRQNISAWEKGNQQPLYQDVVLVLLYHRDWRFDWAHEVLAVLKPHIWALDEPVYLPE